MVQRVKTSDTERQRVVQRVKEWQWMMQRETNSDIKWQWMTASDSSGKTNENGTVHFKEWMIVILSMTKTDALLLQGMVGCN